MKDRTHDEVMAEMYREDPAYALQLLNSILEDGDQSELLIALRQMAKAFGGVQAIARAGTPESDTALPHLVARGQSCTEQLFCDSQGNGYAPFSVQPTPGTCLNHQIKSSTRLF